MEKGTLDVTNVLVCSNCQNIVGECISCGGIFVNKESVFCIGDGEHRHLYCKGELKE